jgi:hypothetical protein
MRGQPCLQRTAVGMEAKEWDWSTAQVAARTQVEETLSEPESLGGDDKEDAGGGRRWRTPYMKMKRRGK